MNNKILQESQRIKEIMGLKSQIIYEAKLPKEIIDNLISSAIRLSDDVQDSLKMSFPNLARKTSVDIDDVAREIRDMEFFENSQIKSLLRIDDAVLSDALLEIASNDDTVKNAVDIIISTSANDPQHLFSKQSLLDEFGILDWELDELIKKTKKKIDDASDETIDVAKQMQLIQKGLDEVSQRLKDLNLDNVSVKELFRAKNINMEIALKKLQKIQSDYNILKSNKEFLNASKLVLKQKSYPDIVLEVETILKKYYPSVYKQFWIANKSTVYKTFGSLIALSLLIYGYSEIKRVGLWNVLLKLGKGLKEVWEGDKEKTYINDQTGFQQFLRDKNISFDPDTAAWSQATGSWMVDIFNQSSRQYTFKDETFEPK